MKKRISSKNLMNPLNIIFWNILLHILLKFKVTVYQNDPVLLNLFYNYMFEISVNK